MRDIEEYVHHHMLIEAATRIEMGMCWGETKEGHDFWAYVVFRLREIADKKKECRIKIPY